jgi:hypothetical protein
MKTIRKLLRENQHNAFIKKKSNPTLFSLLIASLNNIDIRAKHQTKLNISCGLNSYLYDTTNITESLAKGERMKVAEYLDRARRSINEFDSAFDVAGR